MALHDEPPPQGGKAAALLAQATRDAGRIVSDAEKRAVQIGGDAYAALRDKQTLEQAVQALWNVTEGYGQPLTSVHLWPDCLQRRER